MTIWVVNYCPYVEANPSGTDREVPCFRVYPEDDPERWIIETNPSLPHEVQEETAFLVAGFLSDILGI